MNIRNPAQRKPTRASCDWVKEEYDNSLITGKYNWWRVSSCKPRTLVIGVDSYPYSAAISVDNPFGDFWSGSHAGGYYTGGGLVNCSATPNGYLVDASPTRIEIDVWQALQDMVWSSSITFSVYASSNITNVPLLVYAESSPDVYSAPCAPRETLAQTVNPTTACGNGQISLITIYNDGRITIVD